MELRQLAKKIETLCAMSPCYSVAMPIIQNCNDHLTLLARVHEFNANPNPPGYGD